MFTKKTNVESCIIEFSQEILKSGLRPDALYIFANKIDIHGLHTIRIIGRMLTGTAVPQMRNLIVKQWLQRCFMNRILLQVGNHVSHFVTDFLAEWIGGCPFNHTILRNIGP